MTGYLLAEQEPRVEALACALDAVRAVASFRLARGEIVPGTPRDTVQFAIKASVRLR